MRVRDAVTPGTSALFVLEQRRAPPTRLTRTLEDLGVVLIRSDLSEDHHELLAKVLGEESPAVAHGADVGRWQGM